MRSIRPLGRVGEENGKGMRAHQDVRLWGIFELELRGRVHRVPLALLFPRSTLGPLRQARTAAQAAVSTRPRAASSFATVAAKSSLRSRFSSTTAGGALARNSAL